MHLAEAAKRKLNFDEPRIDRMETEHTPAPIWKKKKSVRRLDFGETDPSVLLYCPDLLPDRTDPSSRRVDRIIFTADQKSQLEALFRKKMFPDREEKAALAARIDVPLGKVMTWFSNRRQKWRRELRKGLVEPSGSRPVLPGYSLVQTSYQRSFQSTAGFSHYTEFPARLQVPSQRFPSTPYPVNVPLPSASNLIMRPLPMAVLPPVRVPWQQVYPSFPAPVRRIPHQQYPDIYYQHRTAPSHPSNHSMPARNPVPEPPAIRQVPGAEPESLAGEFPFLYSIAKELPHIFGNLDEDEDLEHPLTPSFEPPFEFESICDSLSESDQSVESSSHSSGTSVDFADHHQPSAYNSCCFGSNGDFSSGFVSKGRNFKFCRQD